jgi:Mrr N-terminal domain
MTVPEIRKVTRALGGTDKVIKDCLRAVNQSAAKLMSRGDYSAAQGLASVGMEIQGFRRELKALRQKWNGIGGAREQKGGKNSATPLWGYYQPILRALITLGGEARRQDIEPEVEKVMKDKFQPGDTNGVSRGRLRWQVMIRRAHRHMVKEGWLEKHAGKVWKITAAGRQAAKGEEKPTG